MCSAVGTKREREREREIERERERERERQRERETNNISERAQAPVQHVPYLYLFRSSLWVFVCLYALPLPDILAVARIM